MTIQSTVHAAAAVGEFPFLTELLLVFAVAAAFTYVCQRLHIVPIVGFLLAGVVIGPNALSLVESPSLIDAMAEIGVILLLFTIGVEFSLRKLALIRRFIVIGGGLQVGLTVTATAAGLLLFGASWRVGVYTGFLVALSSTAIVLKLLSSEGTADTPVGRIGLGVLIFQDLAVVLMVLLIPVLAGAGGALGPVLLALGEALAIVAIILALAYRAVPAILDRIARFRSTELFLLVVVVLCFGIAWLTSLGGISLSLGAFLAGLAVSGSRFREHAVGEILPLRTLFNAVFFVSVGMLLDLRFLVERPGLVVAAALTVLVGKTLITTLSALVLRYPLRIALLVGVFLAQIGEFSFVLEAVGSESGLTPGGLGEDGRQAFLAVTVLLMTATPFLVRAEPRLLRVLRHGERRADERDRDARDALEDIPEAADFVGHPPIPSRDHVVLCGFGLAGRAVQRSLAGLRIPHVVVDLNPVSVLEAQAVGIPAIYGDLTRDSILEEVRAERASVVVVAINDARAVKRIAQRLKLGHPDIELVARVPYLVDANELEAIGAEVVVVEEVESTVHLIEETLHGCGVPAEEVTRQIARFRAWLET